MFKVNNKDTIGNDNWKSVFFLFSWQILLGKPVLSSQYAAYQTKLLYP